MMLSNGSMAGTLAIVWLSIDRRFINTRFICTIFINTPLTSAHFIDMLLDLHCIQEIRR